MKFLWIEDFDDGKVDPIKWKKYFQIEDSIVKNTLEDALEYLDTASNSKNYDAVLIDIRFPVLKYKSTKTVQQIYKEYFQQIITCNTYNKYAIAKEKHGASAGVLLFLALLYRYNYNWNNVVFISANIDDGDCEPIYTLKEKLTKLKYEVKWGDYDYEVYLKKYDDLVEELLPQYSEKKKNEFTEPALLFQMSETGDFENEIIESEIINLNGLQLEINSKLAEINIEKNIGLKYCSVRREFEHIGLMIPKAFEKPNDEDDDQSWTFKGWTDKRKTTLEVVKRAIINICELLDKNAKDKAHNFLSMQRPYNDSDSVMTEDTLSLYLKSIIRKVVNVPRILSNENINNYVVDVVSEIATIWESICKPKVVGTEDEYYAYATYSVMRLTRNWMAHQGIKGIDIEFLAFVFVVSVRGCFEVTGLLTTVKEAYEQEEQRILAVLDKGTLPMSKINYSNITIEKSLENKYRELYTMVKNAIPQNYSGQMKLPDEKIRDPFGLISALGHVDSCQRDKVSVAELYMAFWMSIHYGDKRSADRFCIKNEAKYVMDILEYTYSYWN